MLKNYITIALRNLTRQFMYSFINIVGLAVGIACSLVIFLYVYGEWSHDRHFKNSDRIYRIGYSFFNLGQFAKGPELLGEVLPSSFEGIEAFTRFQKNSEEVIQLKDRTFKELAYHVDSSFFKVFSYSFLQGAANSAVALPHSAVITESLAIKYFGDVNATGRTIEVGKDKTPYTITGIVAEEERPSHLKARLWLSLEFDRQKQYHWTSAALYNYVLLHENLSQADLEGALDQIIATEIFPAIGQQRGKKTLEEYRQDENSIKFYIQPLKDIYLKSKLSMEVSAGGNASYMYIFGIIAIFILTLAAVNFINLSTARATRRAREVGVRKALGTSRYRLIIQFLTESVIISLFSMIIALGLAEMFTFCFFWITGKELSIAIWSGAAGILGVIAFSVAVGLLAGLYPAVYLTGFSPVKVLRGNLNLSRSKAFRNVLVIFQFSISISLIICTSIIIRQLDFMATKDLGFNQENTITVDNVYAIKNPFTFRDELLRHPDVTNASLHSGEPGSKAIFSMYTFQTEAMPNALTVTTYFGDHNFIDVMGFRLIAGRNFNRDLASDTAGVILNESAVRALDIQDNPIGAVLNDNQKVIGLVSDFHWESLRNSIGPLAIVLEDETPRAVSFSQLAIKTRTSHVAGLLGFIEQKWRSLGAEEPMEYHFLDDNFGAILEKEEVMAKAIGFFTILAILISCLGLFGLASYTTDQRTKEIGIRKVLGASATNIVLMLNKQFTRLVCIAILIAIPVSNYAAQQWLSGFAYQTNLSFWIFAGGSLSGLLISFATVAFQSLKASRTNPSETLKCE